MVGFSYENYKNYGKCLKMDNGVASLLVTLDIGPRIISYSLKGGENVFFCDVDRQQNFSDEKYRETFGKDAVWQLFGGHRIWAAPESLYEMYTPDNAPVEFSKDGSSVTFTHHVYESSPLKKSMTVTLDETTSEVTVLHRIENVGTEPKTFAVWAVSAVDAGGTELLPYAIEDAGLLPNKNIVFWTYADIKDPRISFGNKFLTLRQNPDCGESKTKFGFLSEAGKAYYLNKNNLFTISFSADISADHLDRCCNYETYTNRLFLEMETLSPMKKVLPGQALEHTEHWTLSKVDCIPDLSSDKSIGDFIGSLRK